MCLHIANVSHDSTVFLFLILISVATHSVIVINIALGAHLLDRGSYEVAGFYIGFIILLMLFQVFLFIIHTINAYKAPKSGKQLYHTLHNAFK